MENHPDNQSEKTRSAELERRKLEAIFTEEAGMERNKKHPPSPVRRVSVTSKDRASSYQKTMSSIGREMSPSQRVFSRIIHWTPAEKTSEVLGSTLARPNALLAGSLTAFLLTTAVYVMAKSFGYTLSGSEAMASFLLGWLIGLVYDYLRVLITGRQQ